MDDGLADATTPMKTTDAATAPISAAPTKPGRMLLPYYAANLAAIYLPGLLPIALQVKRNLADELEAVDARTLFIDFLASPWASLSLFAEGGVLTFAGTLGNIGSLYAFLLTLWISVLAISIAYCNYAHRYRLTFVLLVLSAGQAIFFAERIVGENQAAEAPPVQVMPE